MRAKRSSPGGGNTTQQPASALSSKYELSRVQMNVDGTGSSKEQPEDASAEYQDTGYFGVQKSSSPTVNLRKNKPPRGPDE